MSDWISYEARLTEGYRRSAKLTWRYGTTYFWGAALLPKPQRKHVHAIYALCRLADDIVDLPNGRQPSHPEPSQMRPEPVEGHQSGLRQAPSELEAQPFPMTPSRPSRTRLSLIPAAGSATASAPSPTPSKAAWPQATVPIR